MITNIKQFLLLENISQMRQFLKSIGRENMENEFDFVKDKFSKTPNLISSFVRMMFDKDNKPHINKDEFELVSNWILTNKHLIKNLPKNLQNYNSLEELQDDIRRVDLNNTYKSFYNSLYRNMKDQIDLLEGDKLDNFIFMINKFLELPEDKRKEFPPLKYFEANNLPLRDFTDAILNFLESGVVNSSMESVLKYATEKDLDIRYNKNNILVIQTNDSEVISKLGSQNWCIVYAQGTYFNRYIGDDVLGTQYIVYNFNLPSSSDLSQYGISIKIDGTTFNGGCQDKSNRPHSLDKICDELSINKKEIFTTNYKDILNKIDKATELVNIDDEKESINRLLELNDVTILNIIFNGLDTVNIPPLIKSNSPFLKKLLKNSNLLSKEIINRICKLPNIMHHLSSNTDDIKNIGDFLINVTNPYECGKLINDLNRNQDLTDLIPIKNQLIKYLNHLIKSKEYDDEDVESIKKIINNQLNDIYTYSRENVNNMQELLDVYTLIHKDEYITENIIDNEYIENLYDFILSEYPISMFTNTNENISNDDINHIVDICKKSTYGFNYDTLKYIIESDFDDNRDKEQSVTLIFKIFESIPEEQLIDNIDKFSEAWLSTIYLHTKSEDKLKDIFVKRLYEKLELDKDGYATITIDDYSDFEDFFEGDIDLTDTYEYFDWDIDDDGWESCIGNINLNNMLLLATALYNDGVISEYKNTITKYSTPEYITIFNETNMRTILSDENYSDLKELYNIVDVIFTDIPDEYSEYDDTIDIYKDNLNMAYNRAGASESEAEWFKEIDNTLAKIFDRWDNDELVNWNNNSARYKPLERLTEEDGLIDELVQNYGDDFKAYDILMAYLDYEGKLEVPSSEYHSPDSDEINVHINEILHEEHSTDIKVDESAIIKFKDFIIKKGLV